MGEIRDYINSLGKIEPIKLNLDEIEQLENEININIGSENQGIERSDNVLLKIYYNILEKVEFSDVWNAIHVEGAAWDEAYAGLTQAETEKVNKILETNFLEPKISLRKITKDLAGLGIDKAQAEMIARTEMMAIMNKAKEIDWKQQDPDEKYKFKWVGPDDPRTTEVSKRIKSRTKNGVSLDDLKKIVREEAIRFATETKSGFNPTRDFQSHIGQRHTYERVS
jgi:hypothetical protein